MFLKVLTQIVNTAVGLGNKNFPYLEYNMVES